MATYEVTIDSADAKSLRILVAAEHWVEAWQEGLVLLGDDPAPEDASCVLDDLTAHIDVPSSGRSFVVRPLRAAPVGPVPERGRPIVMAGDAIQVASVQVRQRRPASGGASEVVRPEAFEDPVARVLSDLERQRLNARPVRIDSHGLPQRIDAIAERLDPGTRRRATPLAVPRSASLDPRTVGERRTRDETLASTPAVAGLDALPQLFRPVAPSSGGSDTALDIPSARHAALDWAVDTAWQHVPCEIALLLDGLDSDLPEVAFSRGQRERETRGCRVPLVHAFRQAACLAPTRVRFAEGARMRFVRPDDQSFEIAVVSTLCAPIAFTPGHALADASGLGLVLINSTRPSGFIDSELRALTYLAQTLASRLDGLT